MGKDEIVTVVNNYINQSIQVLEVENPKFDFKKKRYNLSTVNGIVSGMERLNIIAQSQHKLQPRCCRGHCQFSLHLLILRSYKNQ